MKYMAFVRIRPDGVTEDRLRSDDPELDALLALASAPLPDDSGEGLLTEEDVYDIYELTDEERARSDARRHYRVLH